MADTANNRSQIYFDNTAELVQLTGKNPAITRKGFSVLRGFGVQVADEAYGAPGHGGLNILGEDYGVGVGSPPHQLTLMAGGQSASRITSQLLSLGYKRKGGRLVSASPVLQSQLPPGMAQVLPAGSDVVLGSSSAHLSQIGSPQGATLAGDPTLSALARCLGNVVAASMYTGAGYPASKKPAAVAVGVSQPASNTATPHAVVCVSWPTDSAAASYATQVRKALSGGQSAMVHRPYSSLLTHASVTTLGGSWHVVKWQADAPEAADAVLQMAFVVDLPALPNCSRLPRAQAATIIGCT